MMVERFFWIQQELSAVPDLIPLIPNLLEVDLLAKAFVHLKAFNQITVLLQEEGITFVGACDVFDSVLEDYPELSGHLRPDAKIVVDAIFEKAVIRIAKGLVLTTEQRQSVQGFVLHCQQMVRLLGASVTWLFRLNIKAAYPTQKR